MSLPTSGYTPRSVTVNVSVQNPDTLDQDGATVDVTFQSGITGASAPIIEAIAAAIATTLTTAYPGWTVSRSAWTTGTSDVQLT
ncbi:hypothetical protein AB0M11_08080 [Streptomyces sp. NPDC051987]|uniref:hypothetical protein n=1 Tax=Streptomyces sp. NPDC051987 TaxID=3155808 RepID=UPI0034236916